MRPEGLRVSDDVETVPALTGQLEAVGTDWQVTATLELSSLQKTVTSEVLFVIADRTVVSGKPIKSSVTLSGLR